MNTYEVIRSVFDRDTRKEEVLHFDADSFEFLASDHAVILVFRNELNDMVGAVDGFDYVYKLESEGEAEVLPSSPVWARESVTTTMAA